MPPSEIRERMRRIRRRSRRYVRLARRVARSTVLPRGTRAKLLAVVAMDAARWHPPRDVRLRVTGGPVFVGRRSAYIDAITVLDVWNVELFPARCAGRLVLDIGAHKGYFSAWALAEGAAGVVACEPEASNVDLLRRARDANERARDWVVERTAVAAREATVSLFVSSESWGHSLYPDLTDRVDVQTVRATTLPRLLERARAWRPGCGQVLKLNVEGAAGEIVFGATPDDLRDVVEVHLDHEPDSPYRLDDLLAHLAAAGLDDVDDRGTVRLLRIVRSADRGGGPSA